MTIEDLIKKTQEKLELIQAELKKEPKGILAGWWGKIPSFNFPGGPVRRKLIEKIHERLSEICRELKSHAVKNATLPPCLLSELSEIFNLVEKDFSEDEAWHVMDTLKAVLPGIASDEYIFGQLCLEKRRDHAKKLHWNDLFETKDLDELINDYKKEKQSFEKAETRHLARLRLQILYKERNDLGRHDRAKEGTRGRYFIYLSIVLLVLVVLLAFTDKLVSSSGLPKVIEMICILASGALGATISRAIKMRDIEKISELKTIWSTFLAQVLIGAALAEMVIIILRTGSITIGSTGNVQGLASLLTIGFLTGFSEPFALGILERISGIAIDNNQKKSTSVLKKGLDE